MSGIAVVRLFRSVAFRQNAAKYRTLPVSPKPALRQAAETRLAKTVDIAPICRAI